MKVKSKPVIVPVKLVVCWKCGLAVSEERYIEHVSQCDTGGTLKG